MNIKPRNQNTRRPLRKILIVCEGAQTEPNYFRSFRVASQVCEVKGTGYNTASLVKEAKRIHAIDKSRYSEVWCVFDHDSFSAASIRSAYKLALEEGFKVAASNECFELWYLLHYKFLDVAVNRDEYTKQLKKLLGDYQKNSLDMYEKLLMKQADAIRNAKRLKDQHHPMSDPCQCKPHTTVYALVERLNRLAKKAI